MKRERARWLLKPHDALLDCSIIYKLSLTSNTSPGMWIMVPAHPRSIPEGSLSHQLWLHGSPSQVPEIQWDYKGKLERDLQNLSYEIMVIFLKVPLPPCNIVIKEGHIFLTAAAAASSQTWIAVGSGGRRQQGRNICCHPKGLISEDVQFDGRLVSGIWKEVVCSTPNSFLTHIPQPVFISALSVQTIWINLLAYAIRREVVRCGAWWMRCQKHQNLMNGVLASEPSWMRSFAKSIQADSITMLD